MLPLSEAGMLGATLFEVSYGALRDKDGRRCFMGSALLDVPFPTWGELELRWPWVNQRFIYPCVCGTWSDGTWSDAKGIITHLFDMHVRRGEWTREQVADWIRSVEPRQTDVDADVEAEVKEMSWT